MLERFGRKFERPRIQVDKNKRNLTDKNVYEEPLTKIATAYYKQKNDNYNGSAIEKIELDEDFK